jgi:DNA repair protein RecO (recombination protein O)
MIVTTEAVVLRAMKYRESSKILTLYTRAFGKLSAIAKGARGAKTRFGGALEPMTYVSAVIYKKENRDLHLLSQCDVLSSFHRLSERLEMMSAALSAVELVSSMTHSEEKNEVLFQTLVKTLQVMNRATKNGASALYLFEVRLLDILGFRPDFQACCQCSVPVIGGRTPGEAASHLKLGYGGILCTSCSTKELGYCVLSLPSVKVLQRLQNIADIESVTNMSLSSKVQSEVGEALRRYMENHVDGFHRLKSEAVFAAIS